jgi:class 3 adenylate cyclase
MAVRILVVLGIVLINVFIVLDAVTYPEHVGTFVLMRLGLTGIMLSVLAHQFLSKGDHTTAQVFMILVPVVVVFAAMSNLSGEGYASDYYVGVIYCFVVLVLFPFSTRTLVVLFLVMYLTYTVGMELLWPVPNAPRYILENHMFMLGIGLIVAVSHHYICSLRDRMGAAHQRSEELLLNTLTRHISPRRVEQLLARPDLLKPGAERQEICVLVCKVTNFGRIARKVSEGELFELLNHFFDLALKCIHEHEGTVIRLSAESILAIWNAPFPQADARERTLETASVLRELAGRPASEAEVRLELRTGVGLHFGDAWVGNLGSDTRLDYTAMGEAVVLAESLQSLNQVLGTRILASRDLLKGHDRETATRFLGHFRLAGHERFIEVYEVTGSGETADGPVATWQGEFDRGMRHYQRQEFAEARRRFETVLRLKPADGPSRFYLRRLTEHELSPPSQEWAGEEVIRVPVVGQIKGMPAEFTDVEEEETRREDGGVRIPDHAVRGRIGSGGYGEVWLAENTIGLFHAVKIIHRDRFPSPEPYEREFRGMQKFMPISRSHPGFTSILHVGRNDEAGFFYYIMEAADDISDGPNINPGNYTPRSLSEDLRRVGRLRAVECLSLMIQLTEALDYLHGRGLVHRDIKPSNIIYVDGRLKLADIGLVAGFSDCREKASLVGTEDYLSVEEAGTPGGDLYALGKVLYVCLTGLHAAQFPDCPAGWQSDAGHELRVELYRVCLDACSSQGESAHGSARAMHDLLRALRDRHVPASTSQGVRANS